MRKDFTDDTILLNELKRRNVKAYQFLYINTRSRLYTLALSILRDEEAAKDLIQEFFTDFWEQRLYENIRVSLQAYLYYALRNRAFTVSKTSRTWLSIEEGAEDIAKIEMPRYLENEELKDSLETAINNLPPMAGKTFRMHYQENISHLEIARILGIRKSTVGNHIHHALHLLRNKLKEKF